MARCPEPLAVNVVTVDMGFRVVDGGAVQMHHLALELLVTGLQVAFLRLINHKAELRPEVFWLTPAVFAGAPRDGWRHCLCWAMLSFLQDGWRIWLPP